MSLSLRAQLSAKGIYKARRARMRLRAMMREVYCVEFDDETGYYYYKDTRTGET